MINVKVSAADAGFVNLDEHVIDARWGFGNVLQPQSGFCFGFAECFHGKPMLDRIGGCEGGERESVTDGSQAQQDRPRDGNAEVVKQG